MRILVITCFLLALLPLAVLGHDIYLAYLAAGQAGVSFGSRPILFSDVGWLWITYVPESYDWARAEVSTERWKNLIDPVLQQTAMIVAALPVVCMTALTLALKILQGLPFVSRLKLSRKKSDGFAIAGGERARKKFTYKRK